MYPVNATVSDDPGVAALRGYLHEVAVSLPARQDQRLFRMAVDRVFTLSGHGTVATGTVFSGEVRPGDTVAVMPSGLEVRVRSIHAQNRPADCGRAGQRCALNLAGIETSAISRGDWLAEPRLFEATSRVDVRLNLLSASRSPTGRAPAAHDEVTTLEGAARDGTAAARGAASGLTAWSTLHVYLGTARRVAHVVPLESEVLLAGDSARVQLVFDAPICTLPGDRFIVRDAQATHTVGGGVVLDPFAPARRRRSAARLLRLDALDKLTRGDGDGVSALLQQSLHGLRSSELVRLTGLPPDRLTLPPEARQIDANHERFVLHASRWAALRERAVDALRTFHVDLPDDPGPDVGRLRRIAVPDLPDPLWRALVGELASEGLLVRNGPWLRLPDHNASLSEGDAALVRKLQPAIAAGRFDPPWVRDLAATFSEPEARVRSVLRKSVTQGSVFQVVHDLFYDRDCIDELAAIATRLAHENGTVEAARYRDILGLGRKRTIQILEFFDRVGYTRRVKDSHVLRQDSGWRL
jgi:selenocysteine-specific elongation factor